MRRAGVVVSLVGLVLVVAAGSSALAGEDTVVWYSSAVDQGLCESCFEMEFDVAAASGGVEDSVPAGNVDFAPTMLFVPAASGTKRTWSMKPYIPPKWAAAKPNAATWATTGALGLAWGYLWYDANDSDDDETLKEVGDYTQILTGAAGLGMAIGAKDKKGLIQFGISFGVSTATIQLFKNSADRWRPDGTDQLSFPSGHTQGSFFGAGFIYQRYGPKWGIPALVMASYTGFSRVYGQKHFAGDALSGASIAMLTSFAFVTPADPERAAYFADLERKRNWRFEWEMYSSTVTENFVQAPSDTGTPLDFRFDQNSNPTINGAAALDWRVKGSRHNVRFRYSPFEQRDIGTVEDGTIFGDYVFPETDVFSIYFLGDLRARYAFDILPESKVTLDLGGGMTILEAEVSLYEAVPTEDAPKVDTDAGASEHGYAVAPILYYRVGYDFTKHFGLYSEGDGSSVSGDYAYDVTAKFRYRINPKWDLAAGWRWSEYDSDIEEIRNKFAASGWNVHAAYSF